MKQLKSFLFSSGKNVLPDMKQHKGFTLIELLVVIAIIALLSTVSMSWLGSSRAKGRDARRLMDIGQLRKSLDLYYDTCGGYPLLGSEAYVPIGGSGGLETSTQDGKCIASGETFGSFMNPIPSDPNSNGVQYSYCSTPIDAPSGASSCSTDNVANPAGNTSYQITFTTEVQSGELGAGSHVATPKGIDASL